MRWKRRRYFVRSFQYRLVAFQALYLAVLIGAFFWLGLEPMLEGMRDQRIGVDGRAESAKFLLFLDRHVLPIMAPLTLLVFAHSVVVSHRVAGPLYRFVAVMRSIAAGDLSMRVRIRPRDYLQEEARELDEAVSAMRARVLEAQAQADGLGQALTKLEVSAGAEVLSEARSACASLRRVLSEFRLEPASPSQTDLQPLGARKAA